MIRNYGIDSSQTECILKEGITGFIHVMENLENIFVMECHGNVMEFCFFSGKVMEMSWNFTKMSWKKYVFTNSVITKIFGIISLTIMC